MFEGLKKKFSSFVSSLSKKEEEAVKEEAPVVTEQNTPEIHEEPKPVPKAEAPAVQHHPEPRKEEPAKHQHAEPRKEEPRPVPQTHPVPQPKPVQQPQPIQQPKPVQKVEAPRPKPHPAPETPRKEPKISFTTKVKGFVFGNVKISEKDADPFIEELKMGLLQSDVNYDVTERITDSIRTNLVGKEISSKGIELEIRNTIRASIMGVLTKRSPVDIVAMIKDSKERNELPFKILFLGPNGAGKTTTMAKIASMLLANDITCVMSASDTFRAAAIEQTAHHAGKLGINVIKGTYGADPASVAFDAISHAKAHGIMAVLIDSAGRQETNRSLIEELKKIVRISKPNLKIFIGESISGNALLDQVKVLNQAVGLDGIILTKLDVDAKGGNTLSILSDTTVPILFFGTGEKYTDIIPYDPSFIVDNIIPNN